VKLGVMLALACGTGGCQTLFSIPGVQPEDAPRAGDGPATDADAVELGCTTVPLLQDLFDDQSREPCSAWGGIDTGGSVSSSTVGLYPGGGLAITADPNTDQARGGCESSIAPPNFMPMGIFTKVTRPQTGIAEYQEMCVGAPDNSASWCVEWEAGGQVIDFTDGSGNDFGSSSHGPWPWVRMRPSLDGAAVLAQVSQDAIHWETFAMDTSQTVPATVLVGLIGGTFAPEPTPSTFGFDVLDVCP
jgi:hypothetical protein